MSLPERMRLAARIRDIVQLGEPNYALAELELVVSGSVAVIIRDPVVEPMSRLIVFSRKTLNDQVIACARGALMQSEVAEPRHAERRVITVWLDGRYEVREGKRHAVGNRPWTSASISTGAAERLRAGVTGQTVFIPEVGPVRLVLPIEQPSG